MEMRRRFGATFSVKQFAEQVYKFFGFQLSGLKTRLSEMRAREESWGLVVFESGVVTEVAA